MEYFKPFFVKIAGRARDDDHTSAHDEVVGPCLRARWKHMFTADLAMRRKT